MPTPREAVGRVVRLGVHLGLSALCSLQPNARGIVDYPRHGVK